MFVLSSLLRGKPSARVCHFSAGYASIHDEKQFNLEDEDRISGETRFSLTNPT